jgi:hypothetical protein
VNEVVPVELLVKVVQLKRSGEIERLWMRTFYNYKTQQWFSSAIDFSEVLSSTYRHDPLWWSVTIDDVVRISAVGNHQ